MIAAKNELVRVLFDYSSRIQLLISEASWEDLNDILIQRQKILENFFSNPSDVSKVPGLKEIIKKVQLEDAISLRVLQAQKQEVEKQCLSLKKNRKSVKAYQGL